MTIGIDHNYESIAAKLVRWGDALNAGVAAGNRGIAVAVEREAIRRVSGGRKPPGSYPVPNVRFHLRNSMGSRVFPDGGAIYNTAEYARAIHEGFSPYGNPRVAYPIQPRPFLTDAFEAVDTEAIMGEALNKALPA